MLLWYIKYGGNQLCIPWYQILPPTIRVYMSLSVDTPPRSTSRSSEVFLVIWYYLNVKQINILIFEVQVNRHILFTITHFTQMVFSVSKCWYKLRLVILEIDKTWLRSNCCMFRYNKHTQDFIFMTFLRVWIRAAGAPLKYINYTNICCMPWICKYIKSYLWNVIILPRSNRNCG